MSFKLILPKNLTPNSGSLSSSYKGNINRLDINNLYNTQVDGRVNGGTKGDIGNIEGDIEDHKINRKGRKAMKKGKGSDNVRNRVERRGGERSEERSCCCSYDGNISYASTVYDMRPFNTAIGRNDITPVRKTAANKLS